MSYDNIKLWFARCEDGSIKYIDEINDENKHNTYHCPMCNSNLIPKATKSVKVSSHFAHVDISKCTPESMMHWWFKKKFIEPGDSFTVISEKEVKYICKELFVEQSYTVDERVYIPDVTVITECGKTIYFEMNYSNKKIIRDYLDIWIELKNIVVEIDVRSLIARGDIPKFKALFYNGKCFNVKKNDVYYNTIGKLKERESYDTKIKKRIEKLDWFFDSILKYKTGCFSEDILLEVFNGFCKEDRRLMIDILRHLKCVDMYDKFKQLQSLHDQWYFTEPIPKEKMDIIRKSIKKLENMYKKLNRNYCLRIERESDRKKNTYCRFGRKIGDWSTLSCSYRIILNNKENNHINSEYITGYVVSLNDIDKIYTYYDELFRMKLGGN